MADHPNWHRQEGEGARAYACFCRYRDYGPDRSIRKAVRAYLTSASKDSQPRRYKAHPQPQAYLRSVAWWWGKLSRRYRWVERVKAFDEHQAVLRQKIADGRAIAEMEREVAEEEQQRQLRREEARAARAVGRQILRRVMKAIENRELEGLALSAILPHLQKASTLLEVGQKLERLELGEVTDRTEHKADPKVRKVAGRLEGLLEAAAAQGLSVAEFETVLESLGNGMPRPEG